MTEKKIAIGGMTCAACQAAVERAIASLDGVESVTVQLLSHTAHVVFDPDKLTEDDIFSAVRRAGYTASPALTRGESEQKEEAAYRALVRRLTVSAVFAVLMLYLAMGPMLSLPLPAFLEPKGDGTAPLLYAALELALTLPVLAVNRAYFIDGFHGAVSGSPNMNTLVGTGAGASLLYGLYVFFSMLLAYRRGDDVTVYTESLFFESVTMILTLITLGRVLEARARLHTSDAVRKLMALTPKNAKILRDGETVTVPSDEITVGERVIVRAGGRIPCDGVILSGGGAADESVITGESVPVPKEIGEHVIGGTVLASGYIELEAERVGDDTTVAKIAELVENAASGKAPQQKLADRISRIFVPLVFSIALVTFIVWLVLTKDLHRAVTFGISVLVISCPCALGLATPTAVMCGIGRGASLGILVKSADALDVLAKADVALFDKTGTVTEGRMRVADVFAVNGRTEEDVYALSASLEQKSEHPIALAIVEAACEKRIFPDEIEEFASTFGGGVTGVLHGFSAVGGNREFLEAHHIRVPEAVSLAMDDAARHGKTPVLFAYDGELFGFIALADTLKKPVPAAIRRLQSLGVESVMLTGDNNVTAEAVAKDAGIPVFLAEVKPEQKAEVILSVMAGDTHGDGKRHYTLMVGDGVNDAPALATADCGIAVAHGTEIAMESADAVLVNSDITDVPRAIELARAVMRNIRENLAWAFGYNILCIPIAAGVLFPAFGIALTPMLASAAMSLSSVCVVSNALRLRFFQPKTKKIHS